MEATINQEDKARMVKQSCISSQHLGYLHRVQLLQHLVVDKRTRHRKSGACIPVHVFVGRPERELVRL